ncbi:unnamed protein product (plasmid) [Mycetohabitans rhizoxinica HKI 454]|uniref:Uncharacterized protein n=1 Tax=Mycetohabitans rhizoxinica (strain DSM 19002 / CIP 109453 / HKI 454) TaxID=882378 RepID=E5AUQ1_MYCRK|nr:unnamed protein product [Mycetohabitans rhizoxinica HKI 454]
MRVKRKVVKAGERPSCRTFLRAAMALSSHGTEAASRVVTIRCNASSTPWSVAALGASPIICMTKVRLACRAGSGMSRMPSRIFSVRLACQRLCGRRGS